jgi:hypothetical protein
MATANDNMGFRKSYMITGKPGYAGGPGSPVEKGPSWNQRDLFLLGNRGRLRSRFLFLLGNRLRRRPRFPSRKRSLWFQDGAQGTLVPSTARK